MEFSIILPLLLLLVMGIAQFGMMIGSYLSLQNASREAARSGIIGSSDAEIHEVISSASPNLNMDNLSIDIAPSEESRSSGEALTVMLTYDYELTVPIISSLFGSIELESQTSMRIE